MKALATFTTNIILLQHYIINVESFSTCTTRPNKNTKVLSSLWGYKHASNTLHATKKKKSKSGGGFGKTKKEIDHYAIFPALDEQVKSTLIHMDDAFHLVPQGDKATDEDLTNEIYDRLEQIYGFPNFNCVDQNEEVEEEGSIGDLLSTPSPSLMNSLLLQDEDDEEEEPTKIPYNKLPPFQNVNVIHFDPLVLTIDNFFSSEECEEYKSLLKTPNTPLEVKSKTTGKDSNSKKQRSSTTWFHYYKTMPEFLCKCNKLLGLDDIKSWEEPQIVRYQKNDKYNWHLDALGPEEEKGHGQRAATMLVYLSDLGDGDGGCTMFRDLKGFGTDEWLKM